VHVKLFFEQAVDHAVAGDRCFALEGGRDHGHCEICPLSYRQNCRNQKGWTPPIRR
jgi:hypothetical protein